MPRRFWYDPPLPVACCVLAILSAAPVLTGFQVMPRRPIMLLVVEGDGAVNNIRQRTAREPIVQVVDENHQPVKGAYVTFSTPEQGASATFSNGTHSVMVTTDSAGRAVASGLRPNQEAGQFSIRIRATYRDAVATALILQTNVMAVVMSATSSSTVVGVATTRGSFLIDHVPVVGTGTVLADSVLETQQASSTLQLRAGGSVKLAPGTRAHVYPDHLALQQGAGQLQSQNGYFIEAHDLKVQPDTTGTAAVLIGSNTIEVRALQGQVRVSKNGLLLANIKAGKALSFAEQGGGMSSSPLTTISGLLSKAGNNYLISDTTANVVFQLTGCPAVEHNVGQAVEVTGRIVAGATPAAGATAVLQVDCSKTVVAGAVTDSSRSSVYRTGPVSVSSSSQRARIAGLSIVAVGAGAGIAIELLRTEAASPNQ